MIFMRETPPQMEPHIERIFAGEYHPGKSLKAPSCFTPRRILDIGANIGGFSVWAGIEWPDVEIFAYEPEPENARLFLHNTHRFSNIHFQRCAITCSDKPEVALWLCGTNCGMHRLKQISHAPFLLVPTRHPALLPDADFVKVDTEGSEVEILTGYLSSRFLFAYPEVIAYEAHSREDQEKLDIYLKPNYKEIKTNQSTHIYRRRNV